jgi:uncharacterized Tic20 family protein
LTTGPFSFCPRPSYQRSAAVILVVVFVIVMPPVSEALVATVARLVEFVPVVTGLLAICSVAIDIVLQPILPLVDVAVARGDVVIIRVGYGHGAEKQDAAR